MTAVSARDTMIASETMPASEIAWFRCVLAGLILLNGLVFAFSLLLGSFPLAVEGVIQTLLGNPPSDIAQSVVEKFRMPRAIAALASGTLLALSGAVLQYVTRNPLADPSLVGVSQGAGLFVVVSVFTMPTLDAAFRPLVAFAGAILVAVIIQTIALRRGGGASMRFILIGIAIAAFLTALVTALLTYAHVYTALSAIAWLSGSIHSVGWPQVNVLLVCVALSIPAVIGAARPLSAMRFGPEIATGLGFRVGVTRAGLITLAVAFAACAVAAVGPIGFVGLIAPHMARRLARSSVVGHLTLTALVGALLVGAADLMGRTIVAPIQIPAGLVTAVIGVPVFVALILYQHRAERS